MKKYISPNTEIVVCSHSTILTASIIARCNNWCKLWHICRDRENGKPCGDFILKVN